MLEELRFVQGAIAKKDFIASMTHFAIEDGFVRAYNGMLALCAPIAFDINCKPKAAPLVAAIARCPGTIQLSMTPTGRLRVISGEFKAYIDCIPDETPHVHPEGETIQLSQVQGEAIVKALSTVHTFVSDDASRPWSNGVLLRGKSAFATNNVIGVEYWTGVDMPMEVNIPRKAVDEMLRIEEVPTHIQMNATSITFHYANKRWIRTATLACEWPDMGKLFGTAHNPKPLDPTVFDALEKLKPFVDQMGRVYLYPGTISTVADMEQEEGARVTVESIEHTALFNIEMLLRLKGIAETMDLSTYPAPCAFYGGMLRGVIIGLRMPNA